MRVRLVSSTLLVLAAVLSAMPAPAATQVPPGTGTLQAAIDAAAPGAVLLLTGGSYVGPVVVDKPLHIACATDCFVDANCEAAVAIDIASDRVILRGSKHGLFQVFRGTETQIRIANRSRVDLRAAVRAVNLVFNACGTEQVGIEVSGTSSKVKLLDAGAYNNPRAGLLLSGLAARPKLTLTRFAASDNVVGIVVENSAVGSRRGKAGITIDKALFIDNAVGLAVVGSDGLRVTKSLFVANAQVIGALGITLDATSTGAVISKSEWDDRSGTGTSETDAGAGSCGFANDGFGFPSCS